MKIYRSDNIVDIEGFLEENYNKRSILKKLDAVRLKRNITRDRTAPISESFTMSLGGGDIVDITSAISKETTLYWLRR